MIAPAVDREKFRRTLRLQSAGEGVGHGGAAGGPVTKELAEYALAVAASQIVLLVAAAAESEVPF